MTNATAGRRFRIVPDSDPMSPLDDERVGRFVFEEHNRYFGGDDHKFDSDVDEEVRRSRPFVKLPVYAYVHSGVWIWTTGGDEPMVPGSHVGWDTGQAGWIIADFASCLRAFGRGFTREQVVRALRGEVKVYGAYLAGDFCGFEILAPKEGWDEETDGDMEWDVETSCYGFQSAEDARAAALDEAPGATEVD